jgi:hypothetical protein
LFVTLSYWPSGRKGEGFYYMIRLQLSPTLSFIITTSKDQELPVSH